MISFPRAKGLEYCRECGKLYVCNNSNFPYLVEPWEDDQLLWFPRTEGRKAEQLLCNKCARVRAVYPLQWSDDIDELLEKLIDRRTILEARRMRGLIKEGSYQ